MDKVSVIVPVYKVESYLARCIDALLGQTYSCLEIILIDDASPDHSREIIQKCAKKDQRIVPIYQEQNRGVSSVRNEGLKKCTGEWVCFCDGDDWYEPDFVQKMMDCARREAADYIICNYKIVADNKPAIVSGSIDALIDHCDSRLVIACGPTSSCTHMIRRELFLQSGVQYPVGCRQNEELPVIPVLAKYAKRIAVVNEPLYNYYQRGDGSSASNISDSSEENFLFAWNLLKKELGIGYEAELQYHAIYALMYGRIMELCKQRAKTNVIKDKIAEYEQIYEGCWNNKYLANLGRAKQIFLWLEQRRCIFGLRVLSWIHSRIVN